MRLKDKVTLIVGAGSGIGRAIAVRFAQEGARVAVADLQTDAGQETARLAGESGAECIFVPVDVTRREQVRVLVERVEEHFGRLDVLVNSAGISGRGRVEQVPDDLWDRVVAVNLSGVFWACRYAIPALLRAGGGTIVNIASIAGLRGSPGSAIYSATKGGVVLLSRSMAAAYAGENIRVWAICPPAVDTPLMERFFATSSDPARARREYEANLPMGRLVSTEEVANLALYLASDERFAYTAEPFVV